MPSLSYPASFGDHTRTIDIDQVAGSGAEATWHVFIDRYYEGAVTRICGELVFLPGPGSELQGDDVGAMLEIIADIGKTD